jgi:hypothetical protein
MKGLAITLVFISSLAFSQEGASSYEPVNDAGLWLNGTAEYNFSKKFAASLSEELRFNENVAELGTFFTDAGVSYKFLDGNLKTSLNYRFINKRRVDDYYSQRHRFYFDLSYRFKVSNFGIVFRTRLQEQVADIGRSSDGGVPEWYSRNKLTLKYDFGRKISPFVSYELFTNLNEGINDNVRYTAGFDYEINLIHSVDIFFTHQREMNTERPAYDYIWGLGYTITLDRVFQGKDKVTEENPK